MKLSELRKISKKMAIKYQNGMSTYDIGKENNSHAALINQVLKSEKVVFRTRAEINHKRFAKNIPFSQELSEKLNGWLLGDGHLRFTGVQAFFSFVSKHEEYTNYVALCFEQIGINCRKYHTIDKKYKTHSYRLITDSTIQFAQLYNKWYLNKKKIVPRDLCLNNNSFKTWIMDDGTLDKRRGHFRFCTCSFSIDECEFLSDKINKFLKNENGSWVIEKNKYPRIYLPRNQYKELIKLIGKCNVECFNYKWNVGGTICCV